MIFIKVNITFFTKNILEHWKDETVLLERRTTTVAHAALPHDSVCRAPQEGECVMLLERCTVDGRLRLRTAKGAGPGMRKRFTLALRLSTLYTPG